MTMKRHYSVLILMILLITLGCGGWRSGVKSQPYVGTPPPEPVTPADIVRLPGVELSILLNNSIQTSDIAVMAFAVPIHYDPIDHQRFKKDDKLEVSLDITPSEENFTFDPFASIVTVDGNSYNPVAIFKYKSYPSGELKREYLDHQTFALTKGKYFGLYIQFDCLVPTPDREISLDIGRALMHPTLPAIPKINFMKLKWERPYT
jgi:hypothetical protein